MTFRTALHNHMMRQRLARRMALLKTARSKLMCAAAQTTGPRADAIADLAAYVDVVLFYLWKAK